MKSFYFTTFIALIFTFVANQNGVFEDLVSGMKKAHQYEKAALALAKENRALKAKLQKANFEIASAKTKNDYLQIKLKKTVKRSIASVEEVKNYDDMVKYDVYKWSPDKLLGIAGKEFHFKHFEKAAQFYNELLTRHPGHKIINDKVLFAAGIAAYESGKHYAWSEKYLTKLVKVYPKSKFYRGAKLWLALSKLNMGDKKTFYATVEEFRQKYRNTSEWKILSRHYETITQHYK